MSRCLVKPNMDKYPDVTAVVVGFDRPLQQWFVQVFEGYDQDGEDNIRVNCDCSCRKAAEIIEEYADVSDVYTIHILRSVKSNICPQDAYGIDQHSKWDTTKISNEKLSMQKIIDALQGEHKCL